MTTTHINLGALFFNCAATSPDRAAITFEGQTRTFSEVADRVRRLASSLADRGVAKGDRVAYIGSNHPSLIETLLATTTIGAILVPINCRLTAQEIEFIVGDAGTCAVVTDREVMPLVRTIPSTRDLLLAIVVDDGEPPETPWMSYEALIESAPSEPVEKRMSGGDDDLAVIMYTSGTTGRPKGAMLTHHNFFMHHVNALHAFDIVSNDVTLVIAPLFHIGALNVLTLSTLLKSGHLVITRRFDASETLQMIERLDVSTVFGVPAMFNFIAQDPRFEETDLSSLRFLVCGGAPVPALLIETYGQRGVPFLQAYGLTETAPLALVLDRDDVSRRLGSAGHKQMLLSDVRLVDQDTGHSVPPGTAGEVCVRGPQVMVGYWHNPEATAQAFDEAGYFHTGDIAHEDDDGFIYLIDRSKDMVISGGENVYPAEVEAVLYRHPAIAEAAVIGTPHPTWGEAVTAVVVLRPGAALNLDEIRTFSREHLAGFKLPLHLHIASELPRTQSGKVLKYQLRKAYTGS